MNSDPLLHERRGTHVASAGRSFSISMLARRIVARILHELRGALPPTIFFFVGFNFIVLTTNLLVANYAVAVSNFMLATLAATFVFSRWTGMGLMLILPSIALGLIQRWCRVSTTIPSSIRS